MKKLIFFFILIIYYSTNSNAQGVKIFSPEYAAFKYFQDSIIIQTTKPVQYYFNGKISENCSTMPYGFAELNYNFDTCLSQICTTSSIEFISNQRIRTKNLFNKINLFVNSACKIDDDLYLVNIIYSDKYKGVIYHIFIKDNLFYKLKTVEYIE